MITPAVFHDLFRMIEAAYPQWKPEKGTTEVYYQVLKDLPLDLLKAAILDRLATDTAWAPSPGQLRGAAFRMIEDERGDPSAGEAWGEVMAAVGRYGYIRKPTFSDPLITRCVEAVGGWQLLCRSPIEAMTATRARFLQSYEVLKTRERGQERMLPAVRGVVKKMAAPAQQAQIGPGGEVVEVVEELVEKWAR